jgi:ribonuclease P protein component
MLPLKKRLNLKKDFKWVISGKFFDTQFAKIYIRLGDNVYPKVGIAVSSKHFRKASDRNRARRLISRAMESLYEKLPGNINIVVLPKGTIADVKSGDVLLETEQKLREYKILNEKNSS